MKLRVKYFQLDLQNMTSFMLYLNKNHVMQALQ